MKAKFYLAILIAVFSLTCHAQTTSVVVWKWGVNLSTRLDTIPPSKCDSFGINRSMFKFKLDSTYNLPYYPVVYNNMLLFADSSGKVQNIVVKSYDFEYFTGAVTRSGHQDGREIFWAGLPLARHKVGDIGKITRVECVDLQGRKMDIHIPPFYYVKYRQL